VTSLQPRASLGSRQTNPRSQSGEWPHILDLSPSLSIQFALLSSLKVSLFPFLSCMVRAIFRPSSNTRGVCMPPFRRPALQVRARVQMAPGSRVRVALRPRCRWTLVPLRAERCSSGRAPAGARGGPPPRPGESCWPARRRPASSTSGGCGASGCWSQATRPSLSAEGLCEKAWFASASSLPF